MLSRALLNSFFNGYLSRYLLITYSCPHCVRNLYVYYCLLYYPFCVLGYYSAYPYISFSRALSVFCVPISARSIFCSPRLLLVLTRSPFLIAKRRAFCLQLLCRGDSTSDKSHGDLLAYASILSKIYGSRDSKDGYYEIMGTESIKLSIFFQLLTSSVTKSYH